MPDFGRFRDEQGFWPNGTDLLTIKRLSLYTVLTCVAESPQSCFSSLTRKSAHLFKWFYWSTELDWVNPARKSFGSCCALPETIIIIARICQLYYRRLFSHERERNFLSTRGSAICSLRSELRNLNPGLLIRKEARRYSWLLLISKFVPFKLTLLK